MRIQILGGPLFILAILTGLGVACDDGGEDQLPSDSTPSTAATTVVGEGGAESPLQARGTATARYM